MHDNSPQPALTITIDGHTHTDWLRFSVDSDIFTPADAWQVSLGVPASGVPPWVKPWAAAQVRVGDKLVMTGRLDDVRRRASKGEFILDLSGRDLAAVLLDCSAPIYVRRKATLPEVCATVARPLGITQLGIQQGVTFKKITVEPGMTAWDAIQEAAEASDLWPWFTPDGKLKVASLDYSVPTIAELVLLADADNHKNNVLELSMEEGVSRRYSEVTVLGQSTGFEDEEADTALKTTEKDSSVSFYRPLLRNEGHVEDVAMAKKQAHKILSDGIMDSLTVTAKVRGFGPNKDTLWEPGQRVHVYSPPLGLDTELLLSRRTFQGGRQGCFTALTLKPWGVWVPHSAGNGKAKDTDGGEDDWGDFEL